MFKLKVILLLAATHLAFLASGHAESPKAKTAPVIQPSDEDIGFIKGIDSAYQKAKTVSMDIKKTVKSELIESGPTLNGRVMLSGGRMHMEMDEPEKSMVVIDKKHIWVVNYPSGEFKNSAVQVIRADVASKKARSQNFLTLLARGGILKYFTVSGLQKVSGEERVIFLQPSNASVEFKRAQMVINPKTKLITGLRYWDELNNETLYEFSNVKFNKAMSEKNFSYTPPKDADLNVF